MIGHYLSSALSRLRAAPLSAAMNILALALGLTAFLGAHMIGDYVHGADRGWANAGRIVSFVQEMREPGMAAPEEMPVPASPLARYLRLDFPQLEAVGRMSMSGSATVTAGERSETLRLQRADPEILRIFDLPFLAGDPQHALDMPNGVVLSAESARSLFGDAGAALGQPLVLDGEIDASVTGVVGSVASPSVVGGPPVGAWDILLTVSLRDELAALQLGVPGMRLSEEENWPQPFAQIFALLPADGSLTLRELNAQLPGFAARRVPADQGEAVFRAEPVWAAIERTINTTYLRGPAGVSLTRVFYALGAVVLAVAGLNVANLATAQAVRRSKEIGLRKAIGAGRAQICLQVLTETALLIAAALALTLVLIALALASEPAQRFGLDLVSLARPGFLVGAGAALLATALLAGAWPCLALASVRPLTASRAGTAAAGAALARALMTGAQFAAAAGLLLIVCVMLLQNAMMRRTGLGAQDDPIVVVENNLPGPIDGQWTFRHELLAHPAILSVTASGAMAFNDNSVGTEEISLTGDPASPHIDAQQRMVWFDYFDTVGGSILAGRDFSEERDGAGLSQAPPPSIIDVATAERLGLTPAEAVGRSIEITNFRMALRDGKIVSERGGFPSPIIGVTDSAPFELRRQGQTGFVYTVSPNAGRLIVRISRDNVTGALAHLDATWAHMAPGQPLERHFLDELFDQAFADFNRISMAIIALALVAVAIAAMGMFGMASFTAARRVREVGVRKTLGAPTARVLAMMIWDFSRPVIVANLIAWPFAWLAARLYLDLFITRIGLTPAPFLIALAASLLIAWLAVGGQAWRAARVKPANVLRYE